MLSRFKQLPEWQFAEMDVCPCCCVKQFPCLTCSKVLNTRRYSGCDNGSYLPKCFNQKWIIGHRLKRIWVIRQMKGKARLLLKYKHSVLAPCGLLRIAENRTGQVSQNRGPVPAVKCLALQALNEDECQSKSKAQECPWHQITISK